MLRVKDFRPGGTQNSIKAQLKMTTRQNKLQAGKAKFYCSLLTLAKVWIQNLLPHADSGRCDLEQSSYQIHGGEHWGRTSAISSGCRYGIISSRVKSLQLFSSVSQLVMSHAYTWVASAALSHLLRQLACWSTAKG
eukprot:757138-Hanusia_phi.AAC.2